MMILRSSPASPFGRKVKLAAHLLGILGEIKAVDADTTSETDSLRRENPLGKIPALILDDGSTLYDSRVIVEYLDAFVGGGRIVPADIGPRFRALTLQALADGLMDAALLTVYEGRWRPADRQEPRWVAHQEGKITRALATLEATPPRSDPVDVGQIALACALGYLDLRFAGTWRASHPALVAWLDDFAAKVPAFEATKVQPA